MDKKMMEINRLEQSGFVIKSSSSSEIRLIGFINKITGNFELADLVEYNFPIVTLTYFNNHYFNQLNSKL